MKKCFIIQSAMPVMTNTAIISRAYDADYKYAAIMVTITTILSLFIIPIYKIILPIKLLTLKLLFYNIF